MRSDLQSAGGVAALICMSTFIIGLSLFFTFLASSKYGSMDVETLQHVAFLAQNKAILYAWYLTIYVLFGIFLVILTLALDERLKSESPAIAKVASAFGLIWAGLVIASGLVANVGASMVLRLHEINQEQAASLWQALSLVINGLGGGNEIVGGLWVLLISWASLRSGIFSKGLNSLGMIVGLSGIITAVPALSGAGSIFGMLSIVWFAWLGLAMLAKPNFTPQTAQ